MKKILCAVVAVIGMFIIPAMADETCDGKLYSGTWNQQVTNGNFANSTSSWNMTNGTGTVENNVLHFVNTTSQGVPNQHYNKFIVGNKYLITAQIKGSSSGSTFGAGGGADTTAAIKFNITNENEYKKLSAIVVPVNTNNTFYFYLIGAEGSIFDIKNVMAFDLTQMFGAGNEPATAEEAERLIPVIASSLNISATDGYYATNTGQAYSYCATIKVATTKYNETAFGPLNAALANAISVVDTVVSNTITQAASIATLQTQKQTRPNDIADDNEKCPAGKKCLLVEDASGTPHWYEIVENAWDLPVGYTQLQYVSNAANTYLDTGIIPTVDNVVMEIKVKPSDGSWYIWQSRDPADAVIYGLSGANSGRKIGFSFANNAVVTSTITRTSNILTVRSTMLNGHGILYVHDNVTNESNTQTKEYTFSAETLPLWMFGNQRNDRVNAGNAVYYAKMYMNNELVMDYIPAKRNSDGVVGFYDLASQSFKEANAGTFVAGPVVQ